MVEVGSLIEDGKANDRGIEAGGSSGDVCRGLPSLGIGDGGMWEDSPGLCRDRGRGWEIPGAAGRTGRGTPAVWER